MSLLRISAAIRRLCAELGTDEAAVKCVAKETKADPAEEKVFCPESLKKWFERIPEALASILEESINDKVATEEHPGDSTAEETAQKSKAKYGLGRGMRALLRD